MRPWIRELLAVTCAAMLASSHAPLFAQSPAPASPAPSGSPAPEEAPKLTNDQLDSLVAPIALYPDPLLAQTLVASTYPLEIIQLQQWLDKNKNLKDKALADAVGKQPWDPSIQTMAATPEVVKRLADDIQWTTDLGNAFLAQQPEVMDACQRMRKKAKDKGALESNEQQKVETKTEGDKTIIVVQPSNPEVIYVPSYSPTVVYGPPPYPYPPIYYPPYPPGAAFVSFSFGVMMGAAFWGGSCCGCGWGGSSNVNINVNNNFNRVNHYNNVNRTNNVRGGNTWQHNPAHRGGTPYRDRATADRYGGTSRGDTLSNRQAGARQQIDSRGGDLGSSTRSTAGGMENRAAGATRSGTGTGAGGADRIGNQDLSRGSSAGSPGAFGGDARGYNGSHARASSSRGASSMGSRGGGSRGGGRRR